MTVYRVTAEWAGFPGAPGYSNFHFSEFTGGAEVDQMRGRVRDFFGGLTAWLPAGVSVSINDTIEVYDEESGLLTGWETGEESMVVNANQQGSNFSGPSGAVINWITNTVVGGRRVRGRTFIVPLSTSSYEDDGTLSSNALSDLRTSATALVEDDFDSAFVVWSRPRDGSPGVLAPVVLARVPDMAAVLRSRRD